MPRVTDAHRQAQRERIIAATLAVFAEQGLGAASMSDVIAQSGLSAGAIYGYFKSKDALVSDVAAQLVAGRLEQMEALMQTVPIPDPVTMVRRVIESIPVDVAHTGLVLEVWGAAPRNAELGALAREQMIGVTDVVARYLEAWLVSQGRDASRARTVAPLVTAVIQGYLVRVSILGPEGGEEYLRALEAVTDLV